jgi:hypothetical protein
MSARPKKRSSVGRVFGRFDSDDERWPSRRDEWTGTPARIVHTEERRIADGERHARIRDDSFDWRGIPRTRKP